MKIIKAERSLNIQFAKQEWFDIAKKAGWIKPAEEIEENVEAASKKKKKGRCWKGYEPVPGVKPYEDGSCKKS